MKVDEWKEKSMDKWWKMNGKSWAVLEWMKWMGEWKCGWMKWKLLKTCRWKLHKWLIKGEWMKTFDERQWISLMNSWLIQLG
jgi:hypothetical protein